MSDPRAALSALLYAVRAAKEVVREGATVYDRREADEAYEDAEREIQALARISGAPDMLDILQTIELGLKRGYTPAELLDENSPIRDRIRAAIAKTEGV